LLNLTLDIIGFEELQACQDAAFRHAFAWPYSQRPASLLNGLLQPEGAYFLVGKD
jgi:adenosine deaminase